MLSGGIAALNHRLNTDDALRATFGLDAVRASGSSMSLAKDFALKGQDGGNRGQRRRCARGKRYHHNNATLKRVA